MWNSKADLWLATCPVALRLPGLREPAYRVGPARPAPPGVKPGIWNSKADLWLATCPVALRLPGLREPAYRVGPARPAA
ncbi:hypothetical protein, partial [Pseudescherichia sp.]|uniref:hypothetical protein n=1 Tax=Pseudescherichia sp. TaxID=2055881 RepID=UPI0028981468